MYRLFFNRAVGGGFFLRFHRVTVFVLKMNREGIEFFLVYVRKKFISLGRIIKTELASPLCPATRRHLLDIDRTVWQAVAIRHCFFCCCFCCAFHSQSPARFMVFTPGPVIGAGLSCAF